MSTIAIVDNSVYICQRNLNQKVERVSDKRQILIDTAAMLFYQHGIKSIGINEILKTSGIAKKTLYRYFESKDALVLAVLEQRHTIFIGWLKEVLAGTGSNQDVVIRLFNGLGEWFSDQVDILGDFRGCFFINTAAEYSESTSAISQYCRAHKKQVREVISEQLLAPDEPLLNILCTLKEGAITMAYVSQDREAAQKCIAMLTQRCQL